jgi:hypothetical protein
MIQDAGELDAGFAIYWGYNGVLPYAPTHCSAGRIHEMRSSVETEWLKLGGFC